MESKLVKNRQSSLRNFTEKVILVYACGLSTRKIEEHLREMYDIDVSAESISHATRRVQVELTEWHSRPLEKLYPSGLR